MKAPQKSLKKWTKQKWRTKSGKPSAKTGERYLPEAAIKSLSSAEYRNALSKVYVDALDIGDCPGPMTFGLSSGNYVASSSSIFSGSVDIGDCPEPFELNFGSSYTSSGGRVFTSGVRILFSSLPVKENDSAVEIVFGYIVVADFDADRYAGASPLTVNFTDKSYTTYAFDDEDDITSWLWDFGDGGTSTEQNPEHEFSQGTHDVTLTVYTRSGRSGSITKTILVSFALSYRFMPDVDMIKSAFDRDYDTDHETEDYINDNNREISEMFRSGYEKDFQQEEFK